jgi:TRAP-type C4-dicarboxylate transport system substrate-binding protein
MQIPRPHARSMAVAALLAGLAFAAQAVEFRSADTHNPDDYPTVAAVKYMSEVLEKKSAGKYKIKVFNKGALGTEKETIDQVKIGALDLKSCEAQGFIGLAYYDSGARSIYAKKPIKTVADVKGMKIRVQQSDLWVALINAMGANATPMPYGEVYTGLKTGLIDAAENNIPSFDTAKHVEAVKFYSKTEHSMAPEVLLMSKVVWDKLPKADQDMIRAAAKESVPFQRKKWDEQEAKSLANVIAAGAQISEVDKASFQAVMGPVYDKFMITPDLKRLVKTIQDTK